MNGTVDRPAARRRGPHLLDIVPGQHRPKLVRNGAIFTVFAAAVIGGVSLNGGRGTLVGAFTGILLLYLIQNVLTLAGVPAQWIGALNGLIILIALIVWALAMYRVPTLSGALLGVAAGTAYFPALVFPLWVSFYWKRGAGRSKAGRD